MAGQGIAETIRTRVAERYGKDVAGALVRRGDGWILETQAGRVIFRPTRTRFRRAKPAEWNVGLASPGATKNGTSLIVHAGSPAEAQLVHARIRSGVRKPTVVRSALLDSATKKKGRAGGSSRSKRDRPSPLPDPLDRLQALLRGAGLTVTIEGGKPVVDGFPARFRRVPGYGVLLEDGGKDLHFLPLETLVFAPSRTEKPILNRAPRRRGAAVLRPGGTEEQQIVLARLREIAARPNNSAHATSEAALATPLGRALEAHLQSWTRPPYNLYLLENGAISIRKGAGRIGVLRSDRLSAGSESVSGDFLSESAPWREADLLLQRVVAPPADTAAAPSEATARKSSPNRPSGWRPKSALLPPPMRQPAPAVPPRRSGRVIAPQGDQRHRIEQPPPGVSEELVQLVLQASEEIRLERNAAFSHSVELRSASFTLRFDPIEGEPPRLRVPFELVRRPGRSASGYIWLWTSDPLTLVFTHPPTAQDEPMVWAATLLGFADLTVWPDPEPAQARAQAAPRSRSPRSTGTRERQLPRPRTLSRLPKRARGLHIDALRAHMVVAHKRWLPDGWDASSEKVKEAAALGISLDPGQTWVTGHTRGGAVGVGRTVTVDWRLPQQLADLL